MQLSGSLAAPANISFKSQVKARQEHFNYKLKAKSLYPEWIKNLQYELSPFIDNAIKILRQGKSLEIFEEEALKEKQYVRVTKDGSHDPSKLKIFSRRIEYDDEIYVSGKELLHLLKDVLRRRLNCRFDYNEITQENSKKIFSDFDKVFFCTGAWTFEFLKDLGLKVDLIFKPRYSLGLSLCFQAKKSLLKDYVFIEMVKGNSKKYCLSGNDGRLCYLTSFSKKISHLSELKGSHKGLYNDALSVLGDFQTENIIDSISHIKYLLGVRLRLNHEELSIHTISTAHKDTRLYFCTGFHKSGFYYAPIIGEVVQNFLSQEGQI